MTNIERKSRIWIGVLAIITLLMFLGFSFGYSNTFLIGMIGTGITASLFIFYEVGIVAYIKGGKYRTFTLGDAVVIFGTLVGTLVLFFSISLIPAVGEVLPESIINFTATFAKVIAGVGILAIAFLSFTPKFE